MSNVSLLVAVACMLLRWTRLRLHLGLQWMKLPPLLQLHKRLLLLLLLLLLLVWLLFPRALLLVCRELLLLLLLLLPWSLLWHPWQHLSWQGGLLLLLTCPLLHNLLPCWHA
jgi:hypothetical protein